MGGIVKVRTTIIVFAAVILLQGSSPWEGAAATAPEGVLPATGFYVATNSFPKNTVVDITNIETGRSTRVIVAGGLNSPGLLAVVSREAAELIGMRSGSISRIKMVQPSDPIAYLRFTESMATGFPDYDSGNVITEENLLEELYCDDTYTPPSAAQQKPDAPGISGPSYLLEPEWGGAGGHTIVDLPGYNVDPFGQTTEQQTESTRYTADDTQSLKNEVVKDVPRRIEESPAREIIKDVPEYIVESLRGDTEKDTSEFIVEEIREEIVKDVPEYIAETPREEIIKDLPEKVEQVVETPEGSGEGSGYVMVPTDERPPDGIYGMDPSDIIPGISSQPVTTVDTTSFSVPRIYQLEPRRFYVQIAAFPSGESVENAVRQIDQSYHSYKPVIFKDGDNWYRVLLGGESGLNQGESAAVLHRFKTIGYKDAFVRQGR